MKHYKNYYKILNVNKNATNHEIRESYYDLALEFHPDKLKDVKGDSLYFIEISEAYEILKNKQKRSEYDKNYENPTIFLFKLMMETNLSLVDFEEYVEAGADIKAKNEIGQSVIMIAANRGNLEIVRYLLDKGISPNSHDFLKVNLLMFATMPSLYNFKPPIVERYNDQDKSEYEEVQRNDDIDEIKEDLDKISPPEKKESSNESNQKENNKGDNYQKSGDFIVNKAKVIELLLERDANPMASNIFNGNALGMIMDNKIKEFIDVYYNFFLEQKKQTENFLGEIDQD